MRHGFLLLVLVLAAAFVLGVIALSDALGHAALDASHSLTLADYGAIELARSATDYAAMVSF